MPSLSPATLKNRLETVIALSRLLDRVENSRMEIGADQYRALVRQLSGVLEQDFPEEALKAVLGAHRSAAEIYENLHYAQSGLSRSSLERSVASEMAATQLLARIARQASSRN